MWEWITWSKSDPVALCPPSVSQNPGTIELKYGPQIPSMNFGSTETAIWHVDVPEIRANLVSKSMDFSWLKVD